MSFLFSTTFDYYLPTPPFTEQPLNPADWINSPHGFGGDISEFNQGNALFPVTGARGCAQTAINMPTANYTADFNIQLFGAFGVTKIGLGIRWKDNVPPLSATGYFVEITKVDGANISTRVLKMPSGVQLDGSGPVTRDVVDSSNFHAFFSIDGNRLSLQFSHGPSIFRIQDSDIIDPGAVYITSINGAPFAALSSLLNVAAIDPTPDNLFYRSMFP